jgi:hypothetical protein
MFITCIICEGQNLVPNGNFEQYTSCPTAPNQVYTSLFWINPSGSSPDYFNQCTSSPEVGIPNNWAGFQQAKSGVAYCGIGVYVQPPHPLNYRENLEVPLVSSLVANSCYYFEMYINLGDTCKYTTDKIGVYFTDTLVTSGNWENLPYTPQINNSTGNMPDTMNWILVNGTYTATGGESYIVIGNFNSDINTDSMVVNFNGAHHAYVYIDDVSLTLCTGINSRDNSTGINVYPNPAIDKLIITAVNNDLLEIILQDMSSRKILQQKFINAISINTAQFAKGIYLYEVRNKNGVVKKGKVVKD